MTQLTNVVFSNILSTNMTPPKLGELVTGIMPQRDAVHVAVVQLTAGERLFPGIHIGLDGADKHAVTMNTRIGIVDPFLTKPIEIGQRFWCIMYPGSTLDLHHEWSHPLLQAMPTSDGQIEGEESDDSCKGCYE